MSQEKAISLKNHLKDVASLYDIEHFCFVSISDMENDVKQANVIVVGENEIIDFVGNAVCEFISYIS